MTYDFMATSTGHIPDAAIVQRRNAERFGKHLRDERLPRVGKPMPAALVLHRGAQPVGLWRVKVCPGQWQEHGLYSLKADGTATVTFYLLQDETAVEVDALPAVIKAMFATRQVVLL